MATGSLYDITQLEVNEEDVLVEAGGKHNWSALSSALQTSVSYEFVSDVPFEYMDFRQRYLVTKNDGSTNLMVGGGGKAGGGKPSRTKFYLAYLFNVKVQDADYGEMQAQIPSAIIEDIIADVELMKG